MPDLNFNREAVKAIIGACGDQPDPEVGYFAALAVSLWALRDSGVSEDMLKLMVGAVLGMAPSAETLTLIRGCHGRDAR